MNKKYKREGVLFESKVKSKWIEDEAYFKWVVKYILENPVKAGLAKNIIDYEFSSAREIFGIASKAITDVEFLSGYFHSKTELRKFILEEGNTSIYEF